MSDSNTLFILWLTSIDFCFPLKIGHIFLALCNFLLCPRNCKCYLGRNFAFCYILFRSVATIVLKWVNYFKLRLYTLSHLQWAMTRFFVQTSFVCLTHCNSRLSKTLEQNFKTEFDTPFLRYSLFIGSHLTIQHPYLPWALSPVSLSRKSFVRVY